MKELSGFAAIMFWLAGTILAFVVQKIHFCRSKAETNYIINELE